MADGLQSRAEVAKLARLLERDPGSLSYLEKVAPEDLVRLREQITDLLFDSDRGALQRMAAASRVIPVPVLAKIAEGIFGPLLCARIAGMIEPSRAVDVAKRLPPSFLAEVAISLDPRRATDVIARIPADQVIAITEVLLGQDEYVTMGRFVGHLPDATLLAAIQVADAAELLRIGFVLDTKERLDDVLRLLSAERLQELVHVAADQELWPEVLDLLANVGEERYGELVDVAAAQEDEIVRGLVAAIDQERVWDQVVPVLDAMSDQSARRFAAIADELEERGLLSHLDPKVKDQLLARVT